MPIHVEQTAGQVSIQLSGEIDHHGARSMMGQLEDAIAARMPTQLTLDLSGVTFMDSSGIAVLLRAYRRMAELGGALTVANVPPQALKVLRAAGLERIIRFE